MRATFVLTNYVETRTETSGWAEWNIGFANTSTPPGDKDIQFTTVDNVYSSTVNVESTLPPGIALPYTFLAKASGWANLSQTRMTWQVFGGQGPADTIILDDVAPTDTFDSALWQFDCSNYYLQYASTITGKYVRHALSPESTCTPERVHLVATNVPVDNVAFFVLYGTVTDPRPAGSLQFNNKATLTKITGENSSTAGSANGGIVQTFASGASGPTIPTTPRITDAVCTGPGTNTAPTVQTPGNGNGVTYSTSGTPTPGGTVRTTATLSSEYSWDNGAMPAGWVITSPTTATYTATLADVDCSKGAVPVSPTVTQVTCAGPGVYGGRAGILPASNSGSVSYTVQGNPAPGATVTVTATLAHGYVWTTPLPNGWVAGPNNATAVYSVTFDEPDCIETTTPLAPSVVQAHCIAPGQADDPELTLPANQNGVTYTQTGDVVAGGSATVTATLASGYAWNATLPAGWQRTSPTTATFAVSFAPVDCVETTTPLTPLVEQAKCVAIGDATAPTVTLPNNQDGVTYTKSGAEVQGSTVTVTATLATGYSWNSTLPAGWTASGDNRSATYTVQLANVDCNGHEALVAPHVVQAVCTAPGVATVPVITYPLHQDGITYSTDTPNPEPGDTVIITATANPNYDFDPNPPAGWVVVPGDPGVATFTVVLDSVNCIEMTTPLAPEVTQAVCVVPGQHNQPSVIPAANQDGVTYTVSDIVFDPTNGYNNPIRVMATAAYWYAWNDTLPSGWVVNPVDAQQAFFEVTLDNPSCIETTTPGTPAVTPAQCIAPGDTRLPVLNLPENGEGITYSYTGNVVPGGTVTITATLSSGYEWNTTLPAGWSRATNSEPATFSITFPNLDCFVDTMPRTPGVLQAECNEIPGDVVNPVVALPANGNGITYRIDGVVEPGNTATVVATLQHGYRWATPDALPTGWALGQNAESVSYSVTFDDPDCTVYTTPVAPEFAQAVCTDSGESTVPTLTLPENGTGVTYERVGELAAGESVKVIATLDDGFGWDTLPEGWVLDPENQTAVFTVDFDPIDCVVAVTPPVVPGITQPVCNVPGVIIAPSVALPEPTVGVKYVQTGSLTPGGTVVVTATLEPGYRWADVEHAGWVVEGDTLTHTVVFDVVKCAGIVLSQTGFAAAGIGLGLLIPALLTAAGVAFVLQRNRAFDEQRADQE